MKLSLEDEVVTTISCTFIVSFVIYVEKQDETWVAWQELDE